MSWGDTWDGGRIWVDDDGRKTYWIRRCIRGKRYDLSTRTHSAKAALEHLARFERDPEGYDPTGGHGEPLVLTATLVEAFLVWSRGSKGNSLDWVRKQKRYLAWWSTKLGKLDLRRVTLRDHVSPVLEEVTARTHRIEVLKAFYGWLRRERHAIATAEDPTYGALSVPQARPEQWTRPKMIPRDHHEKVLKHIAPADRDRLIVLAGTGWHVTELHRFAAAGVISPLPSTASRAHEAHAILVCPQRKSGEMQRTPVSAGVVEAATRVRERGSFSIPKFLASVKGACAAAGIDPAFSPGQYRHSVATWAIEMGADPAAVAAFLGHKSQATTKRFYATLAVCPKVPTLA